MALGEKKWKVICQVVGEVLMVACLGIVCSLFACNQLADRLSLEMFETP
ncbi:MAG: hypothetical protein FWF59_12380 [Turicibacter sp.]|nr:hypothetical protein [Turicibacter sp.]